MGIFDTLLSLLGLGNPSSDDDRHETTVSVEREANTDTEAAIKGADAPSAAGADAAASTESLVDGREEPAEPAEAVKTGDAETELGTVESESEGETTGEHDPVDIEDAEESAATGTDTESVEAIKGIGPAYAERLANAGVDSVADLAAADAPELAAAVDLSETRVGRWIERARER
ncbi:MAG: helix-hairpin-helix domain-containing protein [Haloplanus sp.]